MSIGEAFGKKTGEGEPGEVAMPPEPVHSLSTLETSDQPKRRASPPPKPASRFTAKFWKYASVIALSLTLVFGLAAPITCALGRQDWHWFLFACATSLGVGLYLARGGDPSDTLLRLPKQDR